MSVKRTEIKFNLKGLEDLKKKIGDTYITRVGILGSHVARKDPKSPFNNAEIGLIQLYGSISRGIPPRDWLVMPIELKRRELIAAMRSPDVKAYMEAGDYKKVFEYLGEEAERIIKEAFATRGYGLWAQNAQATIDKKGSSMPLIDTSQFRREVSSDVVKKGEHAQKAVAGVSVP